MSIKLLPCPFCGGEASHEGMVTYSENHDAWWDNGSRITKSYFCNCKNCGASNRGTIGHKTTIEAIGHWNARANHNTPVAPAWIPPGDHYVVISERDTHTPMESRYEWDDLGIPHQVINGSDGPIVNETYIRGASLDEVRGSMHYQSRRYGRTAIAKLVIVEGSP